MYNILEAANTHGGNVNYIYELLNEFNEFKKEDKFGIKFQPFKYNESALEDFSYYNVYKELFINEKDWKNIIDKSYQSKDVWLDIFDIYSIKILKNNIKKIYGIKLQTSVLDNNIIYNKLKETDLTNTKLIINIAGRDKDEIDNLIKKYKKLQVNELLFEVGFQAFPTKLEDSGLSKINYLKNKYKNKIVFADHIERGSIDAKILPLISAMYGVDYIEKHIMHSTLQTKYDYNSSMIYPDYKDFIDMQERYISLLNSDFISKAEEEYLNKTYQVPILSEEKKKLNLLDINKDINFKRTDKKGINSNKLNHLVKNFYILNRDKQRNDTLQKEDFKKANIAAIIACRLKSTRLPKKALLKVGKLSSIELCIKNTLRFNNLNHVILATSTTKQDEELKDYTYNNSAIFHRGDPDDVIQRYLDIIDKLSIDVFVRLTGDNVFISSEVFDILLKSHFENGADYTTATKAAVGTNLEIISVSALKRVKKYFPYAEHSEYMSWYFKNNPEYFKINIVDLPKELVRDYRLTLDYEEDLKLLNIIQNYFDKNNLDFTLRELFKFLDDNQNIANINSHHIPKYESNRELIEMLNRETKIVDNHE